MEKKPMTRPKVPTIAELRKEARRVFRRAAECHNEGVDIYAPPHYLPMAQAGGTDGYVRVSLGDGTVAEAKTRLLLCLRALPSHASPTPKKRKGAKR